MWQCLGFENNKKYFEKILFSASLNHAYLFTGEEMIGKRTFALELSEKIVQSNGAVSVDIFVLDSINSESGFSISIEKIRELKKFLSLSSYGLKKVAIINDAHQMTVEAQNALLKILEEPSSSSNFILVTSKPHLLLQTVISRCQELRFPPHSEKIMMKYLNEKKLNQKQVDFLIKLANGRLGLVKTLIDDNGFIDFKKSIEEFSLLLKSDLNTRFSMAQDIIDKNEKDKLIKKVYYWTLYLRIQEYSLKNEKILKYLMTLYGAIAQPQYNQRLALESFLVKI